MGCLCSELPRSPGHQKEIAPVISDLGECFEDLYALKTNGQRTVRALDTCRSSGEPSTLSGGLQ